MEKEKNKNIQKEFAENRNDFIQSKYTNSNTDQKDEMFYQSSNPNTFINSLNLNGVRSYMANNNIINENDPLLTEIYKNNASSKGNESFGSSNYDLVMNQNYDYNPQTSNNNSSIKSAEINSPNYLYTSSKGYSNKNPGNSNNFQYYSEQKIFNPNNILFNNSTKKSTRSSGTKGEVHENNIKADINENVINNINDNDNNICADDINNVGRSSLTKMINECYENNDNDIEDDNELNSNRKDNKMTMNSFDSSQKNYRTNNNSHENENTLDEDGEEEEQNDLSDNNINSLNQKSMNSEKMNFNNDEMCYLLNGNKLNSEYQDSQISDYNIQSKSKQNQSQNDKKEKNVIKSNNNSQLSQNRNKNKNMNVKVKKDINKNQKLPQQKYNNNIKNDLNESHPYQNEMGNKINKNQFCGKIPFQGNYFEYKKYEKYILDNEELLNNGDEEDVFGNYVDSIIKKSYHVYTNRQCPTCAKLLTKGKSCIHCPKFHHTLKSQRNQKIKNNGK